MIRSYSHAILSLSLLSIAPSVLAQSFSGTVGDLNTIFDPPMNINGTICDQHTNTGNEHAYKACSDGVSAARWMAEKYAKNTGKYLGCLDGYYQGLDDGFSAGINPTPDMLNLAQEYVKGANFESANRRAEDQARVSGKTESADQIIQRYRSVVGVKNPQGQVLPDKSYVLPPVDFDGFNDGYETDILPRINSEFENLYRLGWVDRKSPFADKVAAKKILGLSKDSANFCSINETIFGRRQMPNMSLWDIFKSRRQYDFQNYGWRNPDWAWEIFDRDEKTLEQYQTFVRLKNLEKTVVETIPVKQMRYKLDASGQPIRKLDAEGKPAVDTNGQPLFEMEEIITGYRNETRRVRLSDAEVKELTNIYISGFKTSYDRYYARQYASMSYHQEGAEKYRIAQMIGKLVGEDVAQNVARRNAYNQQYRLVSARKYAEKLHQIYKASFDRILSIFENNPVIELNDAMIIGQQADSIFRAGEDLKVQFAVTNLGEATRPSTMSFINSLDVSTSGRNFIFTAPSLERSNYITPVLGQINGLAEARQTVRLGMIVSNPGNLAEVANSLVVRKDKSIILNDYAEIDDVRGTLDFIQGKLDLIVKVKNASSIDSQFISTIEVDLGTAGSDAKEVEPIGARSVRPVALQVSKIDPLALIINGQVSGFATARLGNKTTHRTNFSFQVSVDKKMALVTYLDALATKRTTNTGSEQFNDRLAKLFGMVESFVRDSIVSNVLWKRDVGNTIIADIKEMYQESKRAGRMTKEAQEVYNQLGSLLAKKINDRDFRNGGGLRFKRANKKAYLAAITEFAQISKKIRDHKN